ncbi:MAG: FAD-dependent oxidoreductase [Ktedonobacteraceae bacterium]|nr:FAD-dependent oxidoreductase [Ktedonobacteraceae bacterium]
MEHPSIAIIGAGIAGLTTALTLQDAGFASMLYEASERLGGRIHSDTTTWDDALVTEWCGEMIDRSQEAICSLIQRFGLQTTEPKQTHPLRARNIAYFLGHYYSMQAQDFQPVYDIVHKQAEEAGYPTTYQHYTALGYELDHMSAYDWIERYVKDGHQSSLGSLLETACTGLLGMESREQSALNLVYLLGLQEPGQIVSATNASRSFRIAGGNHRLPEAIAQQLPTESINLNHRLLAIKRNSDNTVTLTFETSNDSVEVKYDHVVLTLPFSTLRLVDYSQAGFDDLKQTAITQLGYGTNSKLFLQFDTRYWREQGVWPHPNNSFITTDLDIRVLWDGTQGQQSEKAVLVSFTGGSIGASFTPDTPYSTSNESEKVREYAHRCLQQLEQVLPGISAHYTGKAALSYPTGDPHILGSYSCWRVGQYTLFGGYEGVRQGPIHFAGEHCSIEAQGYMEGGASEGIRVAREIVQEIHPGR